METGLKERFEVFPWDKNFETGIALIDQQHKKLVGILNKLAAHLADRSCPITLSKVFDELVAYTDYHFKTEEAIWHSHLADDALFTNHHLTHDTFITKLTNLKAEENVKAIDDVVQDILGFLVHWLAFHILDTDKRMSKIIFGIQSGLPLQTAQTQADEAMSGAMEVLIDTVLTMYDNLSVRTMELLRERTERQRAEAALKVSEERWKFILEGAGDGVWDWNIATGEIYRSTDCFPLLGLIESEGQLANQNATIHPDDLLRVKSELEAHLAGNTESFVNEHRVVHRDGHWSWVLSRGKVTTRDANGRPLRIIGTHSDITEREMASLVYQNTSEGMMITDIDNNIITVNPAFTTITGYSLNEVIGKDPNLLSSGQHDLAFYQTMWGEIESSGQWVGEIWNRRKNGEIYPERLAINSIKNPDGTVHRRIAIFNDITVWHAALEKIEQLAFFDQLTRLPNRKLFHDRLTQEIKKAHRDGSIVALLFIDLDHFKDVNDALGHDVGDLLLIEAARRIKKQVRDSDTLARLGGDEFTVILSELTDGSDVGPIAQAIISCLSEAFLLRGHEAFVSASIGIAMYPEDATIQSQLIKNSDQAMYAAKDHGRGCFHFFTKALQEASEFRAHLASDLRHALELRQLEVYYQPIIELNSGEIHKAEALLRWKHPAHGCISPSDFIPIAEDSGMIHEIGDWVFMQAVQQVRQWQTVWGETFQISVNMSPAQFIGEKNNHRHWLDKMQELHLLQNSIVIEITERLLVSEDAKIMDKLLNFRDVGIEIAIDDFGTGYSSLAYLKKFDIDYLKIDQSFTKNLAPDSSDLVLCEAIVVMAHKLGLKVIAEGVETQEQHNLLHSIRCDYGQGYLYFKPVPAGEFESLFIKRTCKD
ncbi:bacteriohemerythrin [Methylomonas sp. OY6]|uniref:Bacteriohemerythrin n=1 Tax=Methylomonas defluvii TaxID=3045149 RepID=A0ABU4UC39_9GAMM|nr:bacteriohemerythrin [Methylomonas sp. OY6]MDX8126930.1 bacteriohemerythrin [Methylomonas sp. OY6]